jgi:hypothetical protein
MAVAEIKGRLTLNDALFHVGLKRAEGAVHKFVRQPMAQLSSAVAGLFTVDTFKRGIEGAIGLGDELWKLNKVTGVSIGSLGALQEASALTGTEMEQIAKGVGFMQRNLINAVKGQGQGQSALRLLKLDAQELVGLKPEVAFQKIGVAINALPDPALRTSAAMRIFGKAGRELLPFFSEVGKANFGSLSDRSRLLQANSEKFHEATIQLRTAEMNLKTGFIGFAAGLLPAIGQVSKQLQGVNFAKVGEGWGKQLVNGIADVFSGRFADRITAALKDKIADGLDATRDATSVGDTGANNIVAGMKDAIAMGLGTVGFSGAAARYHSDAEALRNAGDSPESNAAARLAKKYRSDAAKLRPAVDLALMPTVAPVIAEGFLPKLFSSVLQGGGLSGKLSLDAWRTQFRGGRSLAGMHNETGGLNSEAFGQRGGLGSMAGWDTKAIMGLGTDELQKVLFTEGERRSIQNQLVAAGATRATTSPFAYNAVAAGDTDRRQSYLKTQLRQKLGVDRTNELLEDIKTAVEETSDELSGD